MEASQAATTDELLLKQVGVAATAVSQALNDLLQHIKLYASGGHPSGRYDQATDTILNVTENIFSSMGDAGKKSGILADTCIQYMLTQNEYCMKMVPFSIIG